MPIIIYQHKVTAEAHKKAENMTNCVDTIEFGKFRVKSSTGKHFYCVSYNLICDKDCRSMYCNECKAGFVKLHVKNINYINYVTCSFLCR